MSLVALQTKEPIPGYRLRERLGSGGYGEVWKAEVPGELFKAIKFVYGQLDEDRASRELKALHRVRGVRHPFILSLERIEVVDGQLVIVTELADCSLKDCFDRYRKQGQPGIPRDELLGYMRDAADALDYMNKQHSLQHLDVKPENLLLTAGRIKVADFGLVKDIEEHTVSMMGGLTPVYAPPEVFEGSPTRFSDQYSLAILFQEMLTGQLPFPGKTAAQLAAQHLNAKPRVSPLPEGDRETIQRALSKKPEDRFPSCTDLVHALERGGRKEIFMAPPSAVAASAAVPTELKQSASPEIAATEASRSINLMLNNLEDAARLASPEAEICDPAGIAVDLPPPESLDLKPTSRSTLFIGVGGGAGRALQKLRCRWEERLNPLQAPPAGFLLIDTDATDLLTAARGDDGGSFTSEEVLETPLRKSQDYRQDSGSLLGWLSRRWLYNIPRSLKTEGLRPLGRLAFVDHAPDIFAKLRDAIQTLRDATQARKGDGESPLRIVLTASSAGGTGGGMVADLLFAVRQILEELKVAGDVEVVLFHGTNRVPAQQELAQANTFALLRELSHYHQPAGFAGDPACHLAPRSGPNCGASAIYTIHLGNDLTPELFMARLDRLAEFLFLGAATLAGPFLDAARNSASATKSSLGLRSFGLCQVGFSSDALVDQIAHQVCREALARWIGGPRTIREPRPRSSTTRSNLLAPRSTQNNALAGLEEMLVTRATEMVDRWKMKVEAIVAQVQAISEEELGGNVNSFFQQLAGDANGTNVGAIEQLFGPRDPQADVPEARRSVLRLTLDDRMQPVLKGFGMELRRWIDGLVEVPEARLFGAKWVCRWFRDYFKLQVDQLRESRQRLQHELDLLEPAIRNELDPRVAKSSAGKKAGQELLVRRIAYCKLRLHDMAILVTGQLFVAWQSYVAQAADGLQELSGDVEHWSTRYPEYDFDAPVPQPTLDDPLASIRPVMGQSLYAQVGRMAAEVEGKLTQDFCTPHGGIRATLLRTGEDRLTLTRELERLARQAVLRTMSQINMQDLLFEVKSGDRSLVDLCLEAADPQLMKCGGERRLACFIPQPITEKAARTAMERLHGARFHSVPTILPALGSDVVLLYECGQLSLPHVAARLVDDRPDIAEIADRLLTRVDVEWRPLPVPAE